jgi:hypothetical protein
MTWFCCLCVTGLLHCGCCPIVLTCLLAYADSCELCAEGCTVDDRYVPRRRREWHTLFTWADESPEACEVTTLTNYIGHKVRSNWFVL